MSRSSPQPEIAVSIVVATKDRADQLCRCLEAIAEIRTSLRWELVVVDNGSTDHTPAVIDRFRQELPSVTAVWESVPGLGRAKDAGLAAANGEIVLFTDDDCYVTPTIVDDIASEFDAHPEVAALGGRVMLFDPLDLPITIDESPEPRMYQPRTFVKGGAITGANSSFRREKLLQVGGFDARMGAGTPFPCEDVDAVARVIWAGHHGRYSPRPTVYHHHGRRTEPELERLLKSYDAGRGAYYAKFLRRRDSRWTYLGAFLSSVAADLVKERSLRRSAREVASGIRWYRSREIEVLR